MNKTIVEMVCYLKGEAGFPSSLGTEVKDRELNYSRIFCIKIIGWLKDGNGINSLGRLEIPFSGGHKWCDEFHKILTSSESLSDLFVVKEDVLEFSSNCSIEEQADIVRFVRENYKPKVFGDPYRTGKNP